MFNFFRIKKRKIYFLFILIFNQFLLNAFAVNLKKINTVDLNGSIFNKQNKVLNTLIGERNNFEANNLLQDVIELENFVEETFNSNDFENLQNENKQAPEINTKSLESENNSNNKLNENQDVPKKEKNIPINSKKKIIIRRNNFKQKKSYPIPLPPKNVISTSEFKVPSRGYINLKGPKITLNLQEADAIETLKLISKLGNYGIIVIQENQKQSKITANFEEQDISEVFNSILLSSDLEAVLENNIIFVGNKILNKSIMPKVSKTYRLNQVSAASVADYLTTLGAEISKVMVVSGSMDGAEIQDGFFNKKSFKDEDYDPYGIQGGPLFGLIGTADLRSHTITLIGSKEQMNTAEKYIESLDVRHRQVALTIKIIDVSLTKSDIKNNVFELRTGDTRFISNSGLGLSTGNFDQGNPPTTANVPNIISGGVSQGNFMNWLEAKITNENAKILASPTLILGENPNVLSSGAAAVGDGLDSATIGRPFKNEGFIKVGEQVVTGFTQSANEGVVTCTATEGTAGVTFGAKVDKIDDNGFVTFALSPAISSVTKSVEISGCGIQNTLSVRKLDTGSIRVKNGETLILTGVLQDSDSVNTSKVPILGDIPILGSLFRSNSTQKRKSELIILVTPKILKDK